MMKNRLRLTIATLMMMVAMPAFSADKAAMEETTPPAANGPLEPTSITIPAEAMPPTSQKTPAAATVTTTTTTQAPPAPAQPASTALPSMDAQ